MWLIMNSKHVFFTNPQYISIVRAMYKYEMDYYFMRFRLEAKGFNGKPSLNGKFISECAKIIITLY
jgi:hypothetical protein